MQIVIQNGVISLHFRFIFEYFTSAITLSENYVKANIS